MTRALDDDAFDVAGRVRTLAVTACGRICPHRKKINLSTAFAGQAVDLYFPACLGGVT
jgi:hypothetical protein